MAAAGEAPGGRPGQAVGGAVVAGPDQDRPRDLGGDRRRRARPHGPGRPRRQPRQGRPAAIEESLAGITLAPCHPMLIGLHLDHITLLDRQIAALDDEIEAALAEIPAARGIGADGVRLARSRPGRGGAARRPAPRGDPRRQPRARPLDHRRDRPGHDPLPDAGHLASWAGLAPAARQSGRAASPPKARATPTSRATAPRPPPAPRDRHLPRRAAPPPVPQTRRHPRPMRRRAVHPDHHLAPARLPRGQVRHLSPDWHHRQTHRDRKTRTHLRGLQALGYEVIITPAA